MGIETAARLCGYSEGLGPLPAEAGDQSFAEAVAVDVGGVEEGDAAVEGLVEGGHRLSLVGAAPLAAADAPGTEADLGNLPTRPSEGACVHDASSVVERAGGLKRWRAEGAAHWHR